ncbi:unnamed protein product [Microthlaspi erraticum]|uniref:Uncharacterized protein n=1 Tax=Microthlaspi erraticum TaxID=1685480 RepID=A0A6D2HF24_9BRAS|nr:unnamed protein product [Microthlaspi erraticum]
MDGESVKNRKRWLHIFVYSFLVLSCQAAATILAFFSYFLNSQKFTPFILNSLFLLTISSIFLVFNNESQTTTEVSKSKYAIGFLCTVASSAGSGLLLSLMQLILRKVLKKNTFSVVTDMVFLPVSGGMCASVTLAFTALTWQVYTIGVVGLVFESSSVFTNAITAVGLPIVPILAVVVFRDQMDGTKVISIVLAVWGFVSFAYQHYLDDKKLKNLEAVPVSSLAKGIEMDVIHNNL